MDQCAEVPWCFEKIREKEEIKLIFVCRQGSRPLHLLQKFQSVLNLLVFSPKAHHGLFLQSFCSAF